MNNGGEKMKIRLLLLCICIIFLLSGCGGEIPAAYDSDITLYARYSTLILNADFNGSSYNEKEGPAAFLSPW